MTGRSLLLPLCSGLALAACGKPAPVDTSLAFLNQELADTIVGSPNDRGRQAASGAIGGCPTGDSSAHCGSAATGEVIACGKRYRMSMDWARKLPAGLEPYPGAEVVEAAGNDLGDCHMRIVSYATTASAEDLVDWYRGADKAGFETEHIHRDAEDVVAGTRQPQGDAFHATIVSQGARRIVDLVVNHGR
jgi:hypothetical protein